ncbi:unnamed protein product [Caretta caretta]
MLSISGPDSTTRCKENPYKEQTKIIACFPMESGHCVLTKKWIITIRQTNKELQSINTGFNKHSHQHVKSDRERKGSNLARIVRPSRIGFGDLYGHPMRPATDHYLNPRLLPAAGPQNSRATVLKAVPVSKAYSEMVSSLNDSTLEKRYRLSEKVL